MTMEQFRAPALRISNIVYGRVNDREGGTGRVRYLVDPEGQGTDRAIPEELVLYRWRRRSLDGHIFHGARLSPNIWRAVGKAYGSNALHLCGMQQGELDLGILALSDERQMHHFRLPESTTLRALFEALGPVVLQSLLDRHLAPERADIYGTPDLFLYARKADRISFYRMVEVKKPSERISPDQKGEIAFLNSVGVPARVLRLSERAVQSIAGETLTRIRSK